jgi:hypothetical protein
MNGLDYVAVTRSVARRDGRFVCPLSGSAGYCEIHHAPVAHRIEVWLRRGQEVPFCDDHGVYLRPEKANA